MYHMWYLHMLKSIHKVVFTLGKFFGDAAINLCSFSEKFYWVQSRLCCVLFKKVNLEINHTILTLLYGAQCFLHQTHHQLIES